MDSTDRGDGEQGPGKTGRRWLRWPRFLAEAVERGGYEDAAAIPPEELERLKAEHARLTAEHFAGPPFIDVDKERWQQMTRSFDRPYRRR